MPRPRRSPGRRRTALARRVVSASALWLSLVGGDARADLADGGRTVWGAAMPTAPATAAPSAAPESGCATAGSADASLGPVDAPRRAQVWLDPIEPTSLLTYMELRRLVADEAGRLRIEIDLARGEARRRPPHERVRVWALSMARAGKLEAALREVARDGPARLMARLGNRAGRAALAPEVGLAPGVHESFVSEPCVVAELEHNTDAILVHFSDNPASVRLPVAQLSGAPFDDAPTLDRLRPELGREHLRKPPPAPVPVTLPLQATHPAMRRPELAGITLGGPGLTHRFVLQARDEEDASLFMMLPTVLAARRAAPGQLAVQVVARGSSLGAATLRHRLCAARILGREVAYLEVLASDPPRRERPPHDVVNLLAALDEVPERACAEEPDPAQLDLPDGQWLDGLPRARAELANLATTLLVLRRARRPLTPLLGGHGAD